MQEGSRVIYVDSKGEEHEATVLRVSGTGGTLHKTVDLYTGDNPAKNVRRDVPHAEDATGGHTHWREAPPMAGGLTGAQRASLTPRAPSPPATTRGTDYVYGEGEDVAPGLGGGGGREGEAEGTPGLGGGGGRDETPPAGPVEEAASATVAEPIAGTDAGTGKRGKR